MSQVTIVGDGSDTGTVITGDRLNEFDELLETGNTMNISSLRPIEESITDVSQKVAQLQEYVSSSRFYCRERWAT